MESAHAQRKNEHLSLAAKLYHQVHVNHPFDDIQLIHQSLPEISLADITTKVEIGPLKLAQPFYIEAMTGGSQQALIINQQLAELAAKYHLAMALGSGSILQHDQSVANSFKIVREVNPDGIVIANLSAKASLEQAEALIDLIQADALELHVNAAQELVMADGDRDFHWLANINHLVEQLAIPVIVKEVGFGMDQQTIAQLQENGVQYINVSGRGGTNFAAIEDRRNRHETFTDLYDWGQTTPESLLEARQAISKQTTLLSSGGICSPLDVIKSGVLGASAVGVAGYFLNLLQRQGAKQLDTVIHQWEIELPRLLALLGCQSFQQLTQCSFVLHGATYEYAQQRQLM